MLKSKIFQPLTLLTLLLIITNHDLYSSVDYYKFGKKYPSSTLFGDTGLITIPTAETREEGAVAFVFTENDLYKFGSLNVAPFSWMEASYFYYRPNDLLWGGSRGNYLDKGFSVKFSHGISNQLSLAAGLIDLAGTGLFSREYIIATYDSSSYKFTTGIGFGRFSNNGFKNPFSLFVQDLNTRPEISTNYKLGGSPSYNLWFRGNVTPLLGLEIFLKGPLRGMSLKFDYDDFDYIKSFSNRNLPGTNLDLRKKDSNFNFGINYSILENVSLGLSFVKGNDLSFTINFGGNFSSPFFKKSVARSQTLKSTKGASPKESFYEDLILNINNKEIFLQTAELNDQQLEVAVSSSKFRDPILVHALLGETVYDLLLENNVKIQSLTTTNINVGHELNKVTTPIELFSNRLEEVIEIVQSDSKIVNGNNSRYKSLEFRPTINYPASFTGITPALVNHIGDPSQFYFGALALRLNNEIQFSSRLLLNTEIFHNLVDNFENARNVPDSLLPEVRTNIVSYLQGSDTYINRMQLDFFFSPGNQIFGKLSGGILENMYSGFGAEFLYKPFEKNFSYGLEVYRVKKRDFDRRFDLLDYEVNTGHINLNYHIPRWGILGTLSFGKYLAGDKGYTLDLSRRLKSGFRAGVFFSRTNVSAELFGEGSFDKGFYFQIPIDLFLNDYRAGYINFKLRPLTRDGGQKLEAGNDLIGIMHNTSLSEVSNYWGSFND